MKTKTLIVIFLFVVFAPAGIVYFMDDETAKPEALTWIYIGASVFLLGLSIHLIRKKRGSL